MNALKLKQSIQEVSSNLLHHYFASNSWPTPKYLRAPCLPYCNAALAFDRQF